VCSTWCWQLPSSANLGEVPVVNITLLHFFFSSGSELLGYEILFFFSGSKLLGYGILFFSSGSELLGYGILFFSSGFELLG